ncbi:MAG TPA: permease, partial [Acidobacteriota bacterium]|nr:permease [Acidobacteriota bacterium]
MDLLLLASLLMLLAGPLLYTLAIRRHSALTLLDGLIFVTITGLVLLFVLPHCYESGGWPVFPVALLGLFGPTLVEAFSRRAARRTHGTTLLLALCGVGLHSLLDGAAVAQGGLEGEPLLPLAVVLHRLPVALTIWWLLRPAYGRGVPSLVLILIGAATLFGYASGPSLIAALSSEALSWFQAFVAGSLMHVVFHQPHSSGVQCGCGDTGGTDGWWEGIGALSGIGILTVLLVEGSLHGGAEPQHAANLAQVGRTFWVLALESAPALLIAYITAGLLHAFFPTSSINWLRRGSGAIQAAKGMAVGLPFPVCSCGVVPLYRGLILRGAPATSAMAFLIATPELGLDAVLLSFPLLGLPMTLVRVLAAAVVALCVGWWVGTWTERHYQAAVEPPLEDEATSRPRGLLYKFRKAFEVGFGEVVDHTAPWLLVGILVAALVEPFLSGGWPHHLPSLLEVPLFALLGLPAYICASGATPLVAVLLSGGISPGAALALLLTGPATNITTFGILTQLHGRRTAVVFSL